MNKPTFEPQQSLTNDEPPKDDIAGKLSEIEPDRKKKRGRPKGSTSKKQKPKIIIPSTAVSVATTGVFTLAESTSKIPFASAGDPELKKAVDESLVIVLSESLPDAAVEKLPIIQLVVTLLAYISDVLNKVRNRKNKQPQQTEQKNKPPTKEKTVTVDDEMSAFAAVS